MNLNLNPFERLGLQRKFIKVAIESGFSIPGPVEGALRVKRSSKLLDALDLRIPISLLLVWSQSMQEEARIVEVL